MGGVTPCIMSSLNIGKEGSERGGGSGKPKMMATSERGPGEKKKKAIPGEGGHGGE